MSFFSILVYACNRAYKPPAFPYLTICEKITEGWIYQLKEGLKRKFIHIPFCHAPMELCLFAFKMFLVMWILNIRPSQRKKCFTWNEILQVFISASFLLNRSCGEEIRSATNLGYATKIPKQHYSAQIMHRSLLWPSICICNQMPQTVGKHRCLVFHLGLHAQSENQLPNQQGDANTSILLFLKIKFKLTLTSSWSLWYPLPLFPAVIFIFISNLRHIAAWVTRRNQIRRY